MKKLLFSIISTLIISTNVFAQDIETKKVISTGVGLTESEALKDTTRNAVQQVVGAYILTDTYVKNSQVIKDQILTNSNGFVKGFKIISQTKDDSGLVKIEAEVEVEQTNINKRLGELNISLKDISTNEFKAIALDKFQATKDFKNMFEEIVLKPIKENKEIYEIKILDFKIVDKLTNDFDIYNNDDSLIPFILSFSIDFQKDYIDSIDLFLEKASVRGFDTTYYDYTKNELYKITSFIYFDIDKKEMVRPKEIYIYEFNTNLNNSYKTLTKKFFWRYRPTLIINLNDSNGTSVKTISFTKNSRYSNMSNLISKNYSLGKNFDHYWSGVVEDERRGMGFFNGIKKFELGMYLNEEEVSKIKSSSIEVKWENK